MKQLVEILREGLTVYIYPYGDTRMIADIDTPEDHDDAAGHWWIYFPAVAISDDGAVATGAVLFDDGTGHFSFENKLVMNLKWRISSSIKDGCFIENLVLESYSIR